MNQYKYSEEEDDGMIPNEFSDDSQNDMEEFIDEEAAFEVRPSISSRGSIKMAALNDNQNKNKNLTTGK
jgi:hypothetical protein